MTSYVKLTDTRMMKTKLSEVGIEIRQLIDKKRKYVSGDVAVKTLGYTKVVPGWTTEQRYDINNTEYNHDMSNALVDVRMLLNLLTLDGEVWLCLGDADIYAGLVKDRTWDGEAGEPWDDRLKKNVPSRKHRV